MRGAIATSCIELVLVATVVGAFLVGRAEAGERQASVWIGAGFGPSWHSHGQGDDSQDFDYDVHLSFQRGPLLLGARTTQNGDFSLLDGQEAYSDVALLMGVARVSRSYILSFEAGPAVVSGYEIRAIHLQPPGGCVLLCPSVMKRYGKEPVGGLALESQLLFKPGRAVGIGVYAFGDINHERSFWGINFCIVGGYFPSGRR